MPDKKDWKDLSNAEKITAVIIGIIVLVVIVVIVVAFNRSGSDNESNQEESLAQKVEAKYLESWGVDNLSDTRNLEGVPENIRSITRFEDVSPGTVRVYVQDDITEEEAKSVGKHVMGAVCFDIDNLDFIVPQGVNRHDVNVARSDVPGCP